LECGVASKIRDKEDALAPLRDIPVLSLWKDGDYEK